jgi:hypothetical protein
VEDISFSELAFQLNEDLLLEEADEPSDPANVWPPPVWPSGVAPSKKRKAVGPSEVNGTMTKPNKTVTNPVNQCKSNSNGVSITSSVLGKLGSHPFCYPSSTKNTTGISIQSDSTIKLNTWTSVGSNTRADAVRSRVAAAVMPPPGAISYTNPYSVNYAAQPGDLTISNPGKTPISNSRESGKYKQKDLEQRKAIAKIVAASSTGNRAPRMSTTQGFAKSHLKADKVNSSHGSKGIPAESNSSPRTTKRSNSPYLPSPSVSPISESDRPGFNYLNTQAGLSLKPLKNSDSGTFLGPPSSCDPVDINELIGDSDSFMQSFMESIGYPNESSAESVSGIFDFTSNSVPPRSNVEIELDTDQLLSLIEDELDTC